MTTLEGIYIISFKNGKIRKDESFIKANYKIDKKLPITPEQYMEKINNIKNGIFKVEFIRWDDAENKIFSVRYSKHGLNCVIDK